MSTYDLAVLGKSTYAISPICENHTVFLEPIILSAIEFTSLFFNQNSFCIYPGATTPITFSNQTVQSVTSPGYNPTSPFNLYDCIFEYALSDLQLSQASISPIAQVELRKELTNLTLLSMDIISSTRYDVIENNLVGNTFVISTVFINKNCHVKPVIIKFQYNIQV